MLRLMLLCVVACSTVAFGQIQEDLDVITNTAYWKVGDERSYTFVITEVVVQDGDTLVDQKTSFGADFSIEDLDEKGYTIEIDRTNTTFSPAMSFGEELYGFLDNTTIELETEKSGELKTVSNWQELQEEAIEAAENTVEEFVGLGEIVWRAETLKQEFDSEVNVRQSGLDFINCFFDLNGTTVRISEGIDTLHADSFLYKGQSIDIRIKHEVLNFDSDAGHYTLMMYLEPDPKQFMDMVYNEFVDQAKRNGETVPKRDELPTSLEYYETITATYTTDGWVDNLTSHSVYSQIGQTNYTTIRIQAAQ